MTALLTDNLPLLADAPTGIKKLRGLILELAVRGKLVPQDPSDEPASALLKRIAEEKVQLAAQGKIKKQKSLEKIGDDEKYFELPEKWEWQKFGEIFSLEYGDNLPADKRSNTGEYPVYGSNGVVGTHNTCFVGSPCIVVGRKGSAGALNLCLSSGCCVTDVAYYCVPPSTLSLDFVFKLFSTLGLDSLGKGIKPGLNRNDAYALVLAIPPLAEQHRIVAKIDELMALCDRLEAQRADAEIAHFQLVQALLDSLTQACDAADFTANWQRLAEHFNTLFTSESSIDALKQSLLQLAVMGKLVPQDPSDEPAVELIKKIEREKNRQIEAGRFKKIKQADPIEGANKPLQLPTSWEWARLANVTFQITDGAHHTPTYIETGIPFLSVKDMSGGSLDFTNTRFISKEEHELLAKRCHPQRGDLLLTKIGTTGVPVIVDTDQPFSIFVSVGLIKAPWDLLSVNYLQLLIGSPFVKKQSADGTEGVGNKNLVLRKIANFLIAVPPLAEQRRIVAKVDQLMALCEQLKNRLTQDRQLNEQLASTLVEQALA